MTNGDWTNAWAVFIEIFAKKSPERVQDLISYFLLISKAAADNPNCGWVEYDKVFRAKKANNSALCWGAAEPSLWVTHMISKPGNTSSRPDTRNAEICYQYNYSGCNYQNCKYRHACLICKKDFHPKSVCYKRKAEAEGSKSARGDKREKDLPDTPPRKKHRK